MINYIRRMLGADPAALAQLERARDDLKALVDGEQRTVQRLQAELADERARSRSAIAVQNAFLSRMSHELRTPLNAVQGYAELLLEDADPDAARDLQKIRLSALNLTALVTSVLDLTELQSGTYEVRPESVAIDELVDEVVEHVRIIAEGQGNAVHVDITPGLVGVLDRRMLRSMLFNLLSNANKYTKAGTVRVSGRRVRRAVGHDIEIVISDSGIGMTPRQLEEAFRPFRQADESSTRRYDGSGVGLAVVRGFAEAMGGSVAIASPPGQGATVTMRLPAYVVALDDDDERDEPTRMLR